MWVINNRKFFYTLSILLVIAAAVSLSTWGLKPGIDFTGGSLLEVSYATSTPDQALVSGAVAVLDDNASVRAIGLDGFIIRLKEITPAQQSELVKALSFGTVDNLTVKNFASIGPLLGIEALHKALVSLVLVILAIVLYITFAFRKVSEPVASWKYGLTAIIALVHDVIIPVGAFSILGHYFGYEVDTLFVTALLVILGFSVHDTIVVFDRVRENLHTESARTPFAEVVGKSISQTFARSINTSLTTLIALVVLYFVGGLATEHFSLALIIGIAAGTYSSVFVGSPLLVTIAGLNKKK